MKKIILFFTLSVFTTYCSVKKTGNADVTIIGVAHAARSIGQHTMGFVNCLKNDYSINFLISSWSDTSEIAADIRSMIIDPKMLKKINTPVTIYTDSIMKEFWDTYTAFNYQGIRIAFSWADQTELEKELVDRLNGYFDMILIPDEYLIDVYKKSGVITPVFVLPESIDLEPFLSITPKTKKASPLVFGCSAAFWPRKNLDLLLEAFAQEFGNNPTAKLRIHGRWGGGHKRLLQRAKELKLKNVEIIHQVFTRKEYVDFISTLDCYVLVSKAEAFSISPREALAAGIPCILSNNTAHKTICNTGFVCSVPSNIAIPRYSRNNEPMIGNQFDCHIKDVKYALRKVYTNYSVYAALALQGKEWAKQYLAKNLHPKYSTIVRPSSVILGDKNSLSAEALITDSKTLYAKYKKIIK